MSQSEAQPKSPTGPPIDRGLDTRQINLGQDSPTRADDRLPPILPVRTAQGVELRPIQSPPVIPQTQEPQRPPILDVEAPRAADNHLSEAPVGQQAAPFILEVLPNPPRPVNNANFGQLPSQSFVLSMFEANPLTQQFNVTNYTKPAVTIAFLIAIISFSVKAGSDNPEPNFRAFIVPYFIEGGLELLVALVYKKNSSFILPEFSNSVFFPILCKLLAIIFVTIDADRGTSTALWFSFLPIMPSFYRYFVNSPRLAHAYQRMSNGSGMLGLILGIAETMLMIKMSQSGNQKIAVVFRYLMYCFIVTLVLIGISSLLALCALVAQGCAKIRGQESAVESRLKFPWQVHALTVLMGVDQLLCVLMTSAFSDFFSAYDAIRSFSGPNPTNQLMQDVQDFKDSLEHIKSLAIGTLIYAVIRYLIGLFLMHGAKAGITVLRQELLTRALQTQANPQNTPTVSAPTVEPGTGSKILNLLQVNSNYFVGIGGQNLEQQIAETPAANQQKQAEGAANNNDDLCSICVASPPNCIILDCHHAGICKECSISMMKSKNLCPICRKVINKICVVEKLNSTQYKVLEEIKI